MSSHKTSVRILGLGLSMKSCAEAINEQNNNCVGYRQDAVRIKRRNLTIYATHALRSNAPCVYFHVG